MNVLNGVITFTQGLSAQLGSISNIEAGNAPSLADIVSTAIRLFNTVAFGFVPIAMIGYLIYAGAKRMLAGSDPKKVAESSATLFWAIVGTFVVFGSILIINLFLLFAGFSGGIQGLPNPFEGVCIPRPGAPCSF